MGAADFDPGETVSTFAHSFSGQVFAQKRETNLFELRKLGHRFDLDPYFGKLAKVIMSS
jgi:hypothetical protein